MRILVTGGAGFIGSHIVDLLIKEGHDVFVIDNLSHGKIENINKNARFFNVDIRSEDTKKVFSEVKPDVVYHEAAQISVADSVKDPFKDAQINILGTINILENCKNFNVKKVIYPASAAIFGEPKYLPIDEKHELNMISPYGVTKHTVEHYLKVYNKLYGINYTVLRYSNVYGKRQDSSGEGGVIAIFIHKLLNGETPVIYGDGNQSRDFVYVKDVAAANLIALNGLDNDIYNVSTNTKISINSLLNVIENILKRNVEPEYKSERDGDIKDSYMSYKKLNMCCGWKPNYDLKCGIVDMLK